MPKKGVSEASLKNLRPFGKGPDERRNGNGRPTKWVSSLAGTGYRLSQINDCITAMLSMDHSELQKIKDGKTKEKVTILEMAVASALLKAHKDGELRNIETVLTRVFGFPKENLRVEAATEQTFIIGGKEVKF